MSRGAGFYYHICPELQTRGYFSCFFFTGRYLKWIIRKYGLPENTFTNNYDSYGLTVWRNCMAMVLELKIKLSPLTIPKKDQKLEKKSNGQACWLFFFFPPPLIFLYYLSIRMEKNSWLPEMLLYAVLEWSLFLSLWWYYVVFILPKFLIQWYWWTVLMILFIF